MNRRDFLKASAVAALAAIGLRFTRYFSTPLSAGSAMPAAVRLGGKLFMGTAAGRILVSTDDGLTWQHSADFGEQCRVGGLYEDDGLLLAVIGFGGHEFALASVNGIVWRTIG